MTTLRAWDHLDQHMHVDLVGVHSTWSAPVARLVAPQGFGEQVWQDEERDTYFAMRLSGARVTQARGHRAGVMSRTGGNFVLQVPGTTNRFVADGWCETAHVALNPDLLDRAAALAGQPKLSGRLRPDIVFPEKQQELDMMVRHYVRRAMNSANPPTTLEMESRILHILDRLLCLHSDKNTDQRFRGGLSNLQLRRLADYVDANMGEHISLETLSEIAGCGARHFPRAFRQATGVPPHRWLVMRRLERAKERLSTS
ncbi:MAG: hypothetical protein ACRCSO_09740, partial [Sphingomonas sp.]